MKILTLAEMRTEARDAMLDTDSANYGISNAELDRRINAAYFAVKALQDNHPRLLSATSTGATFGTDDYQVALTITTLRRILAVYPAPGSSDREPNGPPLEYVEPWELRNEVTTLASESTPRQWSAFQHGTYNTASTPAAWWLLICPPALGSIPLIIEALVHPEELVNTTDSPDVDDVTSYAIAWLAAASGAVMLGRPPEFVQQILSRVPDTLQSASAQMQRQLGVDRDVERR